MKILYKPRVITVLFWFSIFLCYQNTDTISAKETNKIFYTQTNKTLTITGQGKIPSSFKFNSPNQIQKIIVKNGITSIPTNAFKDFKNVTHIVVAKSVKSIGQCAFSAQKGLKEITLPGTFQIILKEGDMEANTLFSKKGVDTVSFNSNLDLSVLNCIVCKNFKLKESDAKYKSISGVIYSKDGNDIIRVPFYKKKLVIAEGTKNFCLYSILYSSDDWEGNPLHECLVNEITLPASIQKIEMTKYKPVVYDNELGQIHFNIKTNQLDGRSLSLLYSQLGAYDEDRSLIQNIAEELPEQISLIDGMYITKDGILLTYIGNSDMVTVPKQVTVIGEGAFSYTTTLSKVVLPEGLKEIGSHAFSECMDWLNDNKTWEINIPSTVTTIGDYAFYYAAITEITLPSDLKKLGKYALGETKIKTLSIPDNITKIPEGLCSNCSLLTTIAFPKNINGIGNQAFRGCPLTPFDLSGFSSLESVGYFAFDEVEWSNLTLPVSIKTTKAYAFAKAKNIILPKECRDIDARCGTCPSTTFQFQNKPRYWSTSLCFNSTKFRKGKVTLHLSWNKLKKSGSNEKIGYQIYFSKDRKGKKLLQNVTVNKNVNKLTITIRNSKHELYGKIRPYIIKNGKKIHGKWSNIEANF